MSGTREEWKTRILRALALEVPYRYRPAFEGRPAAVLLLLAPSRADGDLRVLVTQRTEHVQTHKGQYAFPGGMRDPEDPDLAATALRETREEVGLEPGTIELLGELPSIWTPSKVTVQPFVGLARETVEDLRLETSEIEIAQAFWTPLAEFGAPDVYRLEPHESMGVRFEVDAYYLGPHRIWGATGSMLRNFFQRLETLDE